MICKCSYCRIKHINNRVCVGHCCIKHVKVVFKQNSAGLSTWIMFMQLTLGQHIRKCVCAASRRVKHVRDSVYAVSYATIDNKCSYWSTHHPYGQFSVLVMQFKYFFSTATTPSEFPTTEEAHREVALSIKMLSNVFLSPSFSLNTNLHFC